MYVLWVIHAYLMITVKISHKDNDFKERREEGWENIQKTIIHEIQSFLLFVYSNKGM